MTRAQRTFITHSAIALIAASASYLVGASDLLHRTDLQFVAGKLAGDADSLPQVPVIREQTLTVTYSMNVTEACKARGGKAYVPGATIAGCQSGYTMVLPHPCLVMKGDRFDGSARLGCHELQHAAGWPADHPYAWAPGQQHVAAAKPLTVSRQFAENGLENSR